MEKVIKYLKFHPEGRILNVSQGTGINWETTRNMLDILKSADVINFDGSKYKYLETPTIWKKRNVILSNRIQQLELTIRLLQAELHKMEEVRKNVDENKQNSLYGLP